jgi:hypothetical protein
MQGSAKLVKRAHGSQSVQEDARSGAATAPEDSSAGRPPGPLFERPPNSSHRASLRRGAALRGEGMRAESGECIRLRQAAGSDQIDNVGSVKGDKRGTGGARGVPVQVPLSACLRTVASPQRHEQTPPPRLGINPGADVLASIPSRPTHARHSCRLGCARTPTEPRRVAPRRGPTTCGPAGPRRRATGEALEQSVAKFCTKRADSPTHARLAREFQPPCAT